MEPNTPHLLKASIAVFYDAIWNIANASDLARALGDLQAFITDLLDALHNPQSPNMMGAILRVIDKHEPSLWYFLHEVSQRLVGVLVPTDVDKPDRTPRRSHGPSPRLVQRWPQVPEGRNPN